METLIYLAVIGAGIARLTSALFHLVDMIETPSRREAPRRDCLPGQRNEASSKIMPVGAVEAARGRDATKPEKPLIPTLKFDTGHI